MTKISANKLLNTPLITRDGTKGVIKNLLINKNTLGIKYFSVNFGNYFTNRKKLIPQLFVHSTLKEKENPVCMSVLESSVLPDLPLEKDKVTVSQEILDKKELSYTTNGYRDNEYYGNYLLPKEKTPIKTIPTGAVKKSDIKSSLRSFKELKGYSVMFKNRHLGLLKDIVIDYENQNMVSIVVNRGWLDTQYIVAAIWISEIDALHKRVWIDIPVQNEHQIPKVKRNNYIH